MIPFERDRENKWLKNKEYELSYTPDNMCTIKYYRNYTFDDIPTQSRYHTKPKRARIINVIAAESS